MMDRYYIQQRMSGIGPSIELIDNHRDNRAVAELVISSGVILVKSLEGDHLFDLPVGVPNKVIVDHYEQYLESEAKENSRVYVEPGSIVSTISLPGGDIEIAQNDGDYAMIVSPDTEFNGGFKNVEGTITLKFNRSALAELGVQIVRHLGGR